MKKSSIRILISACAVASVVVGLSGCGTPDVDPHQKVDAPGYYNGPMKSKGNTAGAASKEEAGKATGG